MATPELILIGSGPRELIKAAQHLSAEAGKCGGLRSCVELFEEQDASYRESVLRPPCVNAWWWKLII